MKPINLVCKATVDGSKLVLSFKAKANTKGLRGKPWGCPGFKDKSVGVTP